MSDTETLTTPPAVAPVTLPAGPSRAKPSRPTSGQGRPRSVSAPAAPDIYRVQSQCLQLGLSAFLGEKHSIRSLGFTSAVAGEGKTLLALLMSDTLATQTGRPVVLVDCNWAHPCVHKHFGLSATPGLAEWLRHECLLEAICHRVDSNLTVVPAGVGDHDAIRLLGLLRQAGLTQTFGGAESLLIVDLPSVTATAYGSLALRVVDALLLVVRAGVTPSLLVAQTHDALDGLRVEGIVLNQVRSHLPRWLQRML